MSCKGNSAGSVSASEKSLPLVVKFCVLAPIHWHCMLCQERFHAVRQSRYEALSTAAKLQQQQAQNAANKGSAAAFAGN